MKVIKTYTKVVSVYKIQNDVGVDYPIMVRRVEEDSGESILFEVERGFKKAALDIIHEQRSI